MRGTIFTVIFSLFVFASDQIPAPAQDHPILIKDGTLHTVTNGVLEGYDILFENGKITRIEESISATPNMEVITADGKHIFPGLIVSVSTLGLVEVNAMRASVDYNEAGDMTPEVRANVSYNPDSELIPVTRSNGVLFVNSMPAGGRIPGQSSLMKMDGWTWEDATFQHPTALHLNWPDMWINTNPKSKKSVKDQEKEQQEFITKLDEFVDKVRRYEQSKSYGSKTRSHDEYRDLRLESMIPYVNGDKPIFVHAFDVRQIESAVYWAKKHDMKIAIVGGWDAWRIPDVLTSHDVPVVIESVLRLPWRRHSHYQESYTLPKRLHDAGVSFCISSAGNAFQAAHVRDLPNHAAMASAYGLPFDEALKSITQSAADILGVGDKIGSLEVGKDASLFLSDGHILEITTNVERAFISGADIDLNDRHKTLYSKYTKKYQQLGILPESGD